MSELKSKYKILPNHSLVIEYHSGNLTANNYIAFKKKLMADFDFKSGLNHFIHFKKVNFLTSPDDISKFIAFMGENIKQIGQRKVALLTNTPNQVVSTTIYKLMSNNKNQFVEIFSTNENALKWLSVPENELDSVLKIVSTLKI